MNNIETMKLALEALESITWVNSFNEGDYLTCNFKSVKSSITSLRQAIEQAQQAEPWEKFCDSNCVWTDHHPDCKLAERLPLTDEEISDAVREADFDWHYGWTLDDEEPNRFTKFARAIEAAHGIKREA